jgi:hypothetical protein
MKARIAGIEAERVLEVDPAPEYSIGRLTCRYWQPVWRCDGWLAGCP